MTPSKIPNINDIPKIAKSALEEAHNNYPVPKYMDQKTLLKVKEDYYLFRIVLRLHLIL